MQGAPKKFELTHEEKQSRLWAKLKGHLQKELEAKRICNDGLITEQETYRLRGMISAYKSLLQLDDQ